MSFKKKLNSLMASSWQPTLFGLAGLAIVASLMFYKLGSLVNDLSSSENKYHTSVQAVSQIIENPVNAPHKLLVYAGSHYSESAIYLRSVSALLAIIAVALFYYIVSKWYGRLETVIATALFASSSWLLHSARLVTADILLSLIISTIAYGIWIQTTKRSGLAIFLGVFIAVSLIYVPGMAWFVFAGVLWQRKTIFGHIKKSGFSLLASVILMALLVLPIVNALVKTPELAKAFLGLPQELPTAYEYVKSVATVPLQIFVRGPNNPANWLGRFPLVDVFCSAMSFIGAYTYLRKSKLDRTKAIFGLFIFGTLLIGFKAGVTSVLLVAPIYFLVVAGIAYMLSLWLKVFPSNPLAKGIGIGLICAVALLSGYYNLKQYFIAWPNASATKQVYKQR